MGNYVFDAQALVEAVTRDSDMQGSKHDMGGDIVPAFVRRNEAGVYDFKDNEVPGATDRDRGYWRDVGTMRSYYDAHMDVVSPLPVFNLYNARVADLHRLRSPAAGQARQGRRRHGARSPRRRCSRPGSWSRVDRYAGRCCRPAVRVEQGAVVEDSVLMNGVRIGAGAVVRNAILDKEVVVPPGAEIGVDQELDAQARVHGRGRAHRARQGSVVPRRLTRSQQA